MGANTAADANVCVRVSETLPTQAAQVELDVDKVMEGHKLDAVLCVAGGFCMANASGDGMFLFCEFHVKHFAFIFLHKIYINIYHNIRFYTNRRHTIETISVDVNNCSTFGGKVST
jgi:hypothetical protein